MVLRNASCLFTYQNIRIEKKLAPEMNVMTSVKPRMRGSWRSLFGNIGCLAP